MTSPAADVRELLAEARRQRAPFDFAWGQVIAVLRGADDSWLDALRTTRWAWRNSYERVPARQAEDALRAWLPIFDGREIPTLVRCCDHCGDPLGERSDPRSIYCSVRCRRDAAYERERARISDGRKDASGRPVSVLPTGVDAVCVTPATERAAA